MSIVQKRVLDRLAQSDVVRTALGPTGSDVLACRAGQAALGQRCGHGVSGRTRGLELQRGKSSWSLPRRRGPLLCTARRGPRRGYISTSGHQRRGMRQRPPALWVVPASPQCVVTRQLLVPTSAFLAPSLAGSRGQRRGKLQEDLPQGLLHAAQLLDFTLGESPRQFFGTHGVHVLHKQKTPAMEPGLAERVKECASAFAMAELCVCVVQPGRWTVVRRVRRKRQTCRGPPGVRSGRAPRVAL